MSQRQQQSGDSDAEQVPPRPPAEPPRRRRSPWQIAGIVLAVVLGIAGLAALGAIVFVMVALSQWGDNK